MDKVHLLQQAECVYVQWEAVERAKLRIYRVRFGNEPKGAKKRDMTDLIADSDKLVKKYWELCNAIDPKTCCTFDNMCDSCKFRKPTPSLNNWDEFIRWILIKYRGFATVDSWNCNKFEKIMKDYNVNLRAVKANSYRTVYKFNRKVEMERNQMHI